MRPTPKIITTSEGWTFSLSPYQHLVNSDGRTGPMFRWRYRLTVTGCPIDFKATHHLRQVDGVASLADARREVGKLCVCNDGNIPGYKVRAAS